MKRFVDGLGRRWRRQVRDKVLAAALGLFAALPAVNADVPLRALPAGAVPNPGTQQQELTNITFPGEFNVFEFVVTCAGCHGGTIDQHAGHFGNWAGGNMASAARDPVFRANQIGVNNVVKSITNLDGAGNVCFRCHSPNGWLSGRFDPSLGGSADGSQLIQSILLSTDNEGISCETCHRTVGNVTNKRTDVKTNANTSALDKVWNLLAGLFDWEHAGREAKDQAGDKLIGENLPYGDTSLQFQDGVAYTGKYSGTGDLYFSDLPLNGSYTGQIYAVYPGWWVMENATDPVGFPIVPAPAGQPATNSAGQTLAYNPDGTLPPVFEVPIGVPTNPNTSLPIYSLQGLSLEHPTVGSAGRLGATVKTGTIANTANPPLPGGLTPTGDLATKLSPNEFIRSSEFCGTCHDLTVPILNHGMPEQRTFTEWKYSSYSLSTNLVSDPLGKRTGTGVERCQDCHMPTLKHEYNDSNPDSVNPDPALAGAFPYAKNRGPQGGTAFHKLTGSNRDLPDMMKALYPEIDLEVVGAPTGKDPRAFPGMLSDRGPMWDRAKHNTEITLRDGVDVQITQAPTEVVGQPGIYEMKVNVLNKSGHRIPSGYPDGRRFWLAVDVKDANGNSVYKSGVYDEANAELKTTEAAPFNRALTNVIDATTANAVMVYERVTGTCTGKNGAIFPDPTSAEPTACTASPALTNNFILFDNRIPPKGLNYTAAREAGVKFWNYDATSKVPTEDATRYSAQQLADGKDEVTYRFAAPTGTALKASVDVYWQTHSREFMEHLRTQDTSTVRPQRSPNPFDPNYPNNPNYISDSIAGQPLSAYAALDGTPLNDNWGGVAYASWLATGKGAPFLVDRDDTSAVAPVTAPTVTVRALQDGDPDYIDPVTQAPDAFAAKISWTPVTEADGYMIWIRYGKSEATADWDRLAVVGKDVTTFTEHVLSDSSPNSPGKTYGFKVVAFNGKGEAASMPVVHTVASALPLAPNNVVASKIAPESTNSQITLSWNDQATNEIGFDVWRIGPMSRGGVPVIWSGQPPAAFVTGAAGGAVPTSTGGPAGGAPVTGPNTYVDVDAALEPDACYDYQVRSVNVNLDVSTWSQVTPNSRGCTIAAAPTLNLTATPVSGTRVDLVWTVNNLGNPVTGFAIKRDGVLIGSVAKSAATQYAFSDTTALPATAYTYTVEATGSNPLVSASSSVTTPDVPKAPTAVTTVPTVSQITVNWVDNANNEDGFVLERSDNGGAWTPIPAIGSFLAPNTTSYVDTVAAGGLLPNVSYTYRVKAIHLVNGDSAYAVGQAVQLLVPPLAPSNFAATPGGLPGTLPRVLLSWADNSTNETGFNMQRHLGVNQCNAANGWTNLNQPANATSASDTGVAANSGYCYRIQSTNNAGQSAWVTATVTVPAVPATPNPPLVNGATTSSLVVNFTVPNTAIGYEIRRGNTTIVSAAGNGPVAYTNTGLAANTTYTYQVRIANAGGWSGWSSTNGSNGDGTTLAAPPVANADATTAAASTSSPPQLVTVNVLANDQNVPNTNRTLTAGAVTQTHPVGQQNVTANVVCVNLTGTCTLTLGSNGNNNAARAQSRRGTYTYTYTVTVNGQPASAAVTVTVN